MIPVIVAVGAAVVGYAVGKNQKKIKKGAKKVSDKHKQNKADKAKLKEQKKTQNQQLNNTETKAEAPVKETKEKKD